MIPRPRGGWLLDHIKSYASIFWKRDVHELQALLASTIKGFGKAFRTFLTTSMSQPGLIFILMRQPSASPLDLE
jgi:hypothetical protein